MARPRSAGLDGQREQILSAAQLFAIRGYTATTMKDVAAACGVSKATPWHYVHDKHGLLALITSSHVARLEALVQAGSAQALPPQAHLLALIERFMQAYGNAAHEDRVLTEVVRFPSSADRATVLAAQRRVVAAFASGVAACQPELQAAGLHTPLAMLLFGMINWPFTWLKADGAFSHEALATVVTALFFGGLPAVNPPVAR